MISTFPCWNTATQEYVVPRSIPTAGALVAILLEKENYLTEYYKQQSPLLESLYVEPIYLWLRETCVQCSELLINVSSSRVSEEDDEHMANRRFDKLCPSSVYG